MSPATNSAVVDLTIRLAELSDAQAIASLMGELGYPTRAAEMQMRLEPILQDSRYRTFVAVRGGKICGMIGTFCHHSYEHNNVGGRILALIVTDRLSVAPFCTAPDPSAKVLLPREVCALL